MLGVMMKLIPVKILPPWRNANKMLCREQVGLVDELHAIMDNTSISTERLIGSWKT